jgi:cysteinyl-tRNA synthetase
MCKLDRVLGILPQRQAVDLETAIAEKIARREQARKARDFALADAIRAELKAQGIILMDTSDGVKWKKE